MSLLHNLSAPSSIPELNIFTIPPTQTGVEKTYFVDVLPSSQVNRETPLEFNFGGESRDYIDLARSTRTLVGRILTSDDKVPLATVKVAPINNALWSAFDQEDVYFNGENMTSSSYTNVQEVYVKTDQFYSSDAKSTWLTAAGYNREYGSDLNAITQAGNVGLYIRSKEYAAGKTVQLEGPFLNDVFSLNRYLLNNVRIRMVLYPSSDDKFIMSSDSSKKYKFVLEEVKFRICYVRLADAALYGHATALQNQNAIYPYTKSETKIFSISTGVTNVSFDNIFPAAIPSKLFIYLCETDSFNGNQQKNSYKYMAYGLKHVNCYLDGNLQSSKAPPLDVSQPPGRKYTNAFLQTYTENGRLKSNFGTGTTLEHYAEGNVVFVVNLDPAISDGKFYNLVRRGNVRLELQFETPTDKSYTLVVFSQRPTYFEIDQTRNIIKPPV
jgi:hypothetical protein